MTLSSLQKHRVSLQGEEDLLENVEHAEVDSILQERREALPHKYRYLRWGLGLVLQFLIILWITAPHSSEPKPLADASSASGGSPIVGYLVTAGLFVLMIHSLVKRGSGKHLVYYKRIRLVMIAQSFVVLALVVGISAALGWAVPFLDRSWLYRVPVTGGVATNLAVIPFYIRVVGFVYAVPVLLNLPALAHWEEMDYRNGTLDWGQGILRSLRFGMAHCWMGIPMYVGIALSVGGLWFTYQYFRGGIDRSTTYHLAYNLLIIGMLIGLMLAGQLSM